jgi:hypothetical protein
MDALVNFGYTLVATAPSPATSGTSLVVTAGGGALLPAAPFDLTLYAVGTNPLASNAEIVRCTVKSTDTLTITRAQYGTTAQSVAVGWAVDNAVTANLLGQLAPLASPTFTGVPAAPTAAAATNTTQIATTAMVQAAFAAAPSAPPTLSLTNYAPASANYTLSATAMTALDTTNLTTSSFVAPANGRVQVTVSGGILIGAAGARATFAMLNHSGGAQLGPTISAAFQVGTTTLASCVCQTWTVTGLTPGNSYQLDLAGYSLAGGTSYFLAKNSTPLPADFGPCMILVESV